MGVQSRGGSRIFLGGVHHYFNTIKPHSFLAEYQSYLKTADHLKEGGEGGAHPLNSHPRSASAREGHWRVTGLHSGIC